MVRSPGYCRQQVDCCLQDPEKGSSATASSEKLRKNPRIAGLSRGRDSGYPLPPAQTRAGAPNAHGSYLGCWGTWRRSVRSDRVVGSGLVVAGCPDLSEIAPSLVDCVGFAAVAFEATSAARHSGTPPVWSSCRGSRDIENTPAPLARATSLSPSEHRACVVAAWP